MKSKTVTGVASGLVVGLVGLVGSVSGCSTAPSNARITLDMPHSSEAAFGPVANFLDHRCGSLDCHGNIARNLRVWGCEGLRLLPTDAPICNGRLGGRATTPDEHAATYRSLVGLEPTVMSAVVVDNGQDPDLLTFVRKARGEESHKGGALIMPGDDQDRCITSWLEGATDTSACGNAISEPNFPPVAPNN
jgi:hypothetical protein